MSDSTSSPDPSPAKRGLGWTLVPFLVFAAMAGMFGLALMSGKNPSLLPSTMIGKPAPKTDFPALDGLQDNGTAVPAFTSTSLSDGKVRLVNFWASWCAPCVQEHPLLLELKKRTGIEIMGVNYKDTPEQARRFIGRLGNPYAAVGTDAQGRGAIEWGVYGMPETFVVNGRGEIAYKHVGPITAQSLESQLIPAIEAAK